MKTETTPAPKKAFKPVVLKITCETEAELVLMWHIFNESDADLEGRTHRYASESMPKLPIKNISQKTMQLWQMVNDACVATGLRDKE